MHLSSKHAVDRCSRTPRFRPLTGKTAPVASGPAELYGSHPRGWLPLDSRVPACPGWDANAKSAPSAPGWGCPGNAESAGSEAAGSCSGKAKPDRPANEPDLGSLLQIGDGAYREHRRGDTHLELDEATETVMSEPTPPATHQSNRRASRRGPLRTNIHVECRKGTMGLGPNLLIASQDISETGMRITLNAVLEKGQEVEIVLHGIARGKPVKRSARIVWVVPGENNTCSVGVRFDRVLEYAAMQQAMRPASTLR